MYPKPDDKCQACGHAFPRHNYSSYINQYSNSLASDPLGHMYECWGEPPSIGRDNNNRRRCACVRFVPVYETLLNLKVGDIAFYKDPVSDRTYRMEVKEIDESGLPALMKVLR